MLNKIYGGLIVFTFWSLAVGPAVASVTATTRVAPAPVAQAAACEKSLVVISQNGKISDIQFEEKTEDELRDKAVLNLQSLEEKLRADSYSSRTWVQFEHFANQSEEVFEMVRSIARNFMGSRGEMGLPILEDAKTLLHGTSSMKIKIRQLEDAIEGKNGPFIKSLFTSAETRTKNQNKEVTKIAEAISKCRVAIKECKVTLPSVIRDLNSEFVILHKAHNVIVQELFYVSQLKELLSIHFDEATAKSLQTTLDRKVIELQSGKTTIDVLMKETQSLIEAVEKVYGEASTLNYGPLQRAVIDAAKKNIEISMVLDEPGAVAPNYSKVNYELEILPLLAMNGLTEARYSKILELLPRTELTQKQFVQLISHISDLDIAGRSVLIKDSALKNINVHIFRGTFATDIILQALRQIRYTDYSENEWLSIASTLVDPYFEHLFEAFHRYERYGNAQLFKRNVQEMMLTTITAAGSRR